MTEDEPSPLMNRVFCCSMNETHSLPDAPLLNSRFNSIGAAVAERFNPFCKFGSDVALKDCTTQKSRNSKLVPNPLATSNGVP